MEINDVYRDENGQLHRLDGPAKVDISIDGGTTYCYYIHGDLIMEVFLAGVSPDTAPIYQATVLAMEIDVGINAQFYLTNSVVDKKETSQEVNIYVGDFSSHLTYCVRKDITDDSYMFVDNKYKGDYVCSPTYPGHFHSSVPDLPGTLYDDSLSSCGSRYPRNAKGVGIFYDHLDESSVTGFGTDIGRPYFLPAISSSMSYSFSTGEVYEPLLDKFIARGGLIDHSVGNDVHIFRGVDYTSQMRELYSMSSSIDVDDPGFMFQIEMMEDRTRE